MFDWLKRFVSPQQTEFPTAYESMSRNELTTLLESVRSMKRVIDNIDNNALLSLISMEDRICDALKKLHAEEVQKIENGYYTDPTASNPKGWDKIEGNYNC